MPRHYDDYEPTYEDFHESRYEHQPDVDEPGEDVYDGEPDDYDEHQPDEAQEWHDYDPDC